MNSRGLPENNFTDKQWRSLEEAVNEYAGPKFERIVAGHIMGHRDLIKRTGAPYKACPSFSVQEWLTGEKLQDRDAIRLEPSGTLARNKDEPPAPGLPTPQLSQSMHVGQKGDTVEIISRLYGVPFRTLMVLNPALDLVGNLVGKLIKLHPSAGR